MERLEEIAREIVKTGPSRVMVAPDEALSSARARERGIVPDVIFIRADGWSLGAPEHLEHHAELQWIDEWIGVLRRPSTEPIEYRHGLGK